MLMFSGSSVARGAPMTLLPSARSRVPEQTRIVRCSVFASGKSPPCLVKVFSERARSIATGFGCVFGKDMQVFLMMSPKATNRGQTRSCFIEFHHARPDVLVSKRGGQSRYLTFRNRFTVDEIPFGNGVVI